MGVRERTLAAHRRAGKRGRPLDSQLADSQSTSTTPAAEISVRFL